jgi:hypothetical protein
MYCSNNIDFGGLRIFARKGTISRDYLTQSGMRVWCLLIVSHGAADIDRLDCLQHSAATIRSALLVL